VLAARDGLVILFDKRNWHKGRIIQTCGKSCNL
jgi:hypothetical protein